VIDPEQDGRPVLGLPFHDHPAPESRRLNVPRPAGTGGAARTQRRLSRDNLGFLLAKASQRWNELLGARFADRGFPEIRAAYGSVLIPLYEEDGLRIGELAQRARLSKQTMTDLARRVERAGLVERQPDPGDGRAAILVLTERARTFQPVAEEVLRELERELDALLKPRQRQALEQGLRSLIDLER